MTTTIIGNHSIYASQIPGVMLDCDIITGLKIGGGAPTNNTTVLNNYLAAASVTNPLEVIIDGGCAINSLIIPNVGRVTIRGLGQGTGFYCLSGTNNDVIKTAGTGSVLTLKDFFVNCNSAGNSTGFNSGLAIQSITNVHIDNVYVYDAQKYQAIFADCPKIMINNSYFDSPGRLANTDGIHLNGGCGDVIITSCHFETGDDAIAINSDEGSGTAINRVIVANCTFVDCNTIGRIYGKNKSTSQIIFDNLVGTYRYLAFVYGLESSGTAPSADANHSVTISNCDLSPSGVVTPVGFMWLNGSGGSLVMQNIQMNNYAYAIPMIISDAAYNSTGVLSSLAFDGCQIYRSTSGSAAAYLLQHNGGTIKTISLNNFRVTADASYSAIANLITTTGSASITNLVINGVYAPSVTNIYSGSIGTVTNLNSGSPASVSPNIVYCGPVSGGSATPAFRALVAADLPAVGGGGLGLNLQKFTSSGTFTTSAGSSSSTIYYYKMIGSGGGGGGSNGSGPSAAGGGGAGAYAEGTFTGIAASTAIAITIGAGGSAGSSSGGNGGAGGNTSIGTPVSITCGGGSGGIGSTSSVGAVSLGGSGGTIAGTISPGVSSSGQSGTAGFSVTSTFNLPGCGAPSIYGAGGTAKPSAAGVSGVGFGSGGSGGGYLSAAGGAGAPGLVMIFS